MMRGAIARAFDSRAAALESVLFPCRTILITCLRRFNENMAEAMLGCESRQIGFREFQRDGIAS
jgi:hypothetical protein